MTAATTTTVRDLILVLVILVTNGLVIRVVPVLLDGRQTQGSFVDDSFQFPLSRREGRLRRRRRGPPRVSGATSSLHARTARIVE